MALSERPEEQQIALNAQLQEEKISRNYQLLLELIEELPRDKLVSIGKIVNDLIQTNPA